MSLQTEYKILSYTSSAFYKIHCELSKFVSELDIVIELVISRNSCEDITYGVFALLNPFAIATFKLFSKLCEVLNSGENSVIRLVDF